MLVWNEGKNFETELLNDNDVLAILSKDEIREAFDLSYHTKHVDFIFNRVFNT
jgi:adenylosuccinate lyase